MTSSAQVRDATGDPPAGSSARLAWVAGAALAIAAAFALYRPALRLGLLSDDFALLMWARRLELAPRDWGQIRPLPILSWWLLAQLTTAARTAAALHALNITLHGLNAVLVAVIARRLTARTATALAAGALFLVLPVSVEPVAWGSGVFDVMLTTCALGLAVVVTRRLDLSLFDQAVCLVLALLMMASKETGVVAGALTLLVAWTRWGRISRSAATVAAAQLLLAAGYTAAREYTGRLDHRLVPQLDVSAVVRVVSGIGRAFVLPLHESVIAAHPILAAACAITIVAVIAGWVVRCRQSARQVRIAILALAGTVICVAPAVRLFGITPDLQGTRYVYLAGAWWTIALAAALAEGWTGRRTRVVMAVVTTLLIAGGAAATQLHLRPWTAARAERDRVLGVLVGVPLSCRQAAASGTVDNVSGAYVFRNGLNEALAPLGRSFAWVEWPDAAPECRVRLER